MLRTVRSTARGALQNGRACCSKALPGLCSKMNGRCGASKRQRCSISCVLVSSTQPPVATGRKCTLCSVGSLSCAKAYSSCREELLNLAQHFKEPFCCQAVQLVLISQLAPARSTHSCTKPNQIRWHQLTNRLPCTSRGRVQNVHAAAVTAIGSHTSACIARSPCPTREPVVPTSPKGTVSSAPAAGNMVPAGPAARDWRRSL